MWGLILCILMNPLMCLFRGCSWPVIWAGCLVLSGAGFASGASVGRSAAFLCLGGMISFPAGLRAVRLPGGFWCDLLVLTGCDTLGGVVTVWGCPGVLLRFSPCRNFCGILSRLAVFCASWGFLLRCGRWPRKVGEGSVSDIVVWFILCSLLGESIGRLWYLMMVISNPAALIL